MSSANCTRLMTRVDSTRTFWMSSSRHDDVAPLLELVALDELGVRHLALAVRAPALLLDARLALGVELVEGDACRRIRSPGTPSPGMLTRLTLRKPFQVGRGAMTAILSVQRVQARTD